MTLEMESGRTGLKYPMAVVVQEAPAVNSHAVERGVLTHVGERLLKILGVAVDPVGREIRFF